MKAYWQTNGWGFFNQDADGNLVFDGVINKLLDPEEVLGLISQFPLGTPFFDANDGRYLVIETGGKIVMTDGIPAVVANSFEEFMERIVIDPTFYDRKDDEE